VTKPVNCDPGRIAQLLSNLLGNALTHGSATAPVRVQAICDADTVELSVANAGDPIPPAARVRLFQPFYRGEVRPSRQGWGLGLYIANEIAKAHGRSLNVVSTPEETRFAFRMARN
jgi:phosphoserine phosphatase RsbU/P